MKKYLSILIGVLLVNVCIGQRTLGYHTMANPFPSEPIINSPFLPLTMIKIDSAGNAVIVPFDSNYVKTILGDNWTGFIYQPQIDTIPKYIIVGTIDNNPQYDTIYLLSTPKPEKNKKQKPIVLYGIAGIKEDEVDSSKIYYRKFLYYQNKMNAAKGRQFARFEDSCMKYYKLLYKK